MTTPQYWLKMETFLSKYQNNFIRFHYSTFLMLDFLVCDLGMEFMFFC